MRKKNPKPPRLDPDLLLRLHIISRAKLVSGAVLERLVKATNDLGAGKGLAALGGIDGIERDIQTLRSFLLLLP